MSLYRYDQDADVYVVDCAGKVTLETGTRRLRVLGNALAARPPQAGVAKLLIDFRNTAWQDEDTHLKLSRLTRTKFGLTPDNPNLRVAIVNTRWSGHVADNERWFLSDVEAWEWLCATGTEGPSPRLGER